MAGPDPLAHLDWPFFEPTHRELARALERATGIAATNPAAPAAEARPTPEAGAKNLAALVADLRAGRATR